LPHPGTLATLGSAKRTRLNAQVQIGYFSDMKAEDNSEKRGENVWWEGVPRF